MTAARAVELFCPDCDAVKRHEPAANGFVACEVCHRTVESPLDLGEILADVEAYLRRYVATLSDAHFAVLAVWVAHTWVIAAAETTPYLHVSSPEPESGKTRLLEALDLIACGAAPLIDPSAASLYRGLDSGQITTLLVDEVDNFLPGGKADSETKRTVLGILNGGYRRGVKVPRVTDGRNLQWFVVFGPKVLTGLAELPQTLASRSLRFRMKKRRTDEPVERFRRKRALVHAEPIREQLQRWATEDVVSSLTDADPELPGQLSDRQQDACELLVAVADLAGDGWPERVRAALVQVVEEAHEQEVAESLGTLLLADLQQAFDALGDRAATSTLLGYLNTLEERPWGGWNNGTGLNQRNLASRLKRFEVRSITVWLGDGKTAKGYKREAFADAFGRYLRPETVRSVRTQEPCRSAGDSEASGDPAPDGSKTAASLHEHTGLTLLTPTGRGESENGATGTSPDDLPLPGDPGFPAQIERAFDGGWITVREATERLWLHQKITEAVTRPAGEERT